MDRVKPEPLKALLEQGRLGRLTAEARERQRTTDQIRRLLSPDEGRELIAAHRDADGALTLLMSSAAWAARVRYRAAELGAPRLIVRVAPRGARA